MSLRTAVFAQFQGILAASFVLALVAAPAHAEKVQHTFDGNVMFVSDGTGGTLDLRGTFSTSDNVTIALTIERSTSPVVVDDMQAYYLNPISLSSYTIGSYSQVSAVPVASIGFVGNDVASGLQSARVPLHRTLGAGTDYFTAQIQNPTSPPIGGAIPVLLILDLYDDEGTSFPDVTLPRMIPDLSNFEVKVWQLQFVNGTTAGFVTGTLGGITTPASSSTWGRVKASYRD